MMPNRMRSGLVVGCLILVMAAGAMADDIREMRLFGPPNVSPYGDGPEPAEGFFFTFDGLYWWISTPEKTPIGFPDLTRNVYFGPNDTDMVVQSNTHDTGFIKNFDTDGNRYEVGRIIDRWGWFVSHYNLSGQGTYDTLHDVDMVFVDDAFGPAGSRLLEGWYVDDPVAGTAVLRDLPVTFDEIDVVNRVEHWSVELNAVYRTRRKHHGGFFEFFAGCRYPEFDEEFKVDAIGATLTGDSIDVWEDNNRDGTWEEGTIDVGDDGFPLRTLGNSRWRTRAENNIVGPQVGVRWFRQHGHWRLSTEGRFFAGFNNQNIHQTGVFGSQLDASQLIEGRPAVFDTTGFENEADALEFSPGAEFRIDLHYQLTRAISVKVGWTGFYLDGIARASSIINYEVPTMGLNMGNNRQDVFIHGLNIGVEANR